MKDKKQNILSVRQILLTVGMFPVLAVVLLIAGPGKAQAGAPKNKIVAEIATKIHDGNGIVCSPHNKHVYFVGYTGAVCVIDTTTNAVLTTFRLTANHSNGIQSLAITPDGSQLYMTDLVKACVYAVSTSDRSVSQLTPFSKPSFNFLFPCVAVTPDGTQFWVGSTNGIYVGNTSTNEYNPNPIALPGTVNDIVFTPDGSTAYVSYEGYDSAYLAQIDVSSQTIINSTVASGTLNTVFPLAMNPNGNTLYAADWNYFYSPLPDAIYSSTYSLNLSNDVTTFLYTADIRGRLNETAYELQITPDGNYLYLGISGQGGTSLVCIDPTSGQTEGPAVKLPGWFGANVNGGNDLLAIRPDGKFIYTVTDRFNRFTGRDKAVVTVIEID